MAVTHDTGPRVLCGIAVALLSVGCGLETMPRTGLAEQQNLTVVGSELRIRVRALAGPYVGAIEEAADDAAQRCRDPAIRVQALEWKLGSIPQAQDALLQADRSSRCSTGGLTPCRCSGISRVPRAARRWGNAPAMPPP